MAASLKLPYLATAAASGLLFGAGLYVSQMVDPLKVLRFLDFGAIPRGGWDPSLALVIAPAIVVMFVAVRLARRRPAPLFDRHFHLPTRTRIDAPLVVGVTSRQKRRTPLASARVANRKTSANRPTSRLCGKML